MTHRPARATTHSSSRASAIDAPAVWCSIFCCIWPWLALCAPNLGFVRLLPTCVLQYLHQTLCLPPVCCLSIRLRSVCCWLPTHRQRCQQQFSSSSSSQAAAGARPARRQQQQQPDQQLTAGPVRGGQPIQGCGQCSNRCWHHYRCLLCLLLHKQALFERPNQVE